VKDVIPVKGPVLFCKVGLLTPHAVRLGSPCLIGKLALVAIEGYPHTVYREPRHGFSW